jgi:hypothetical protein
MYPGVHASSETGRKKVELEANMIIIKKYFVKGQTKSNYEVLIY